MNDTKAVNHLMYSITEVDTPVTPLTPRPPQKTSAHSQHINILTIEQNDEQPGNSKETEYTEAEDIETSINAADNHGAVHSSIVLMDIKKATPDGMSLSLDLPSSDLSDSESEPNELKFIESGVDETSRDERDEQSEIENFDLSSCGEDSLEAMYYNLRKNEILLDKQQKLEQQKSGGSIRPVFPEKSTENLNTVVRVVSGKKPLNASESIESSSTDDVILKKISMENESSNSEGDEEVHAVEKNLTEQDSNEDEFINPIIASMRQNENLLHRMHAKALSMNDAIGLVESTRDSEEHDTFTELPIDDLRFDNIQQNVSASSMSEGDSDYFEKGEKVMKVVQDDFNISTALDHVPGSTDSESTLESAATKIQAGANGYPIRKRNRRSTSGSAEKHSSIGNAAIDMSLDEVARQHNEYYVDDTFDDDMADIEADTVLGITEVKVEQRKVATMTDIRETEAGEEQYKHIIVIHNYEEQRTDSMDVVIRDQYMLATPPTDENGTAQRRMTLQRGDALQRNSTPDTISRENSSKADDGKLSNDAVEEEPNMESTNVVAITDNIGVESNDDVVTEEAKAPIVDTNQHQSKGKRVEIYH